MPEVTAMRVDEGIPLYIVNGSPLSMDATQQQLVYLNAPRTRLVIEEQPAPVFRFRYQSEHGSHGSLMGENSDKGRKTYPRIRIENVIGRVRFRVSLFTYKDEETNGPGSPGTPVKHVHMLNGKGCNKDAGVCEVEYDIPEEGRTVDFPNLYISHVAKRSIPTILYDRYVQEHFNELVSLSQVGWGDGQLTDCQVLDEQTNNELKTRADTDAKSMEKKLNSVVLCFEAEMKVQNMWVRCCEPVFSNPINNQKAAATGSLKICRIDRAAGSIKGGDDVFILCEKVDKKNIKVRFFKDEWEDYGSFNEFDVHHQYAIVFKTPKYKDISLGEDVQVKIELYRPSDGAASNSVEFTYIPDDDYDLRRKKRKKIECPDMFKDSKSYSCMQDPSSSSFMEKKPSNLNMDLPGTSYGPSGSSASGIQQEPNTADILDEVLRMEQHQNPFLQMVNSPDLAIPNVTANDYDPMLSQNTTPDFQALIDEFQSEEAFYGNPGGPNDAVLTNINGHDFRSNLDFSDLETDSADQTPPKDSKVLSRGSASFDDDDLQTDGIESVSPSRTVPPTKPKSKPRITYRLGRTTGVPVVKRGSNGKMNDNELVYRLALQTAKKLQDYARTSDVKNLLITMRHLTAVPDDNGDNALHLASIHCQQKAIIELLRVADLDPINAFNELIQTPLHIAAHVNNSEIVAALLQNGADISLLDRNGDSALHIAAKHGKHEVMQAIMDKKNYCKEQSEKLPILDSMNYNGYAPLHLAVMAKSLECVNELCLAKCDVNIPDGTSGRTPLHLAIEYDCEEILKFLLKQESLIVDYQAFNGYTSLHLACSMKKAAIIKLLVSCDADPYVETCEPVGEQASSDEECSTPDTASKATPNLVEEEGESRGCNSFDIARDDELILKLLRPAEPSDVPQTNLEPHSQMYSPAPVTALVESEPEPSRCNTNYGDSGLCIDDDSDSDSRTQPGKDSGFIERSPFDVIDDPTKKKLAKLLDADKKWMELSKCLELSHLDSIFDSETSPTMLLLQYIDTLDELYNGLDNIKHEGGITLLHNFFSEKDVAEQQQNELSKKMSHLKCK